MHTDVVIVGAGLSGIGAACHLRQACPDHRFVVLEGRDAIGGTWDQFRYPGIRSDSDMHTLGYSFRPWTEAMAIADGPSILRYVQDTADQFDVTRHVRLGHRVTKASWSTSQRRWSVEATLEGGTTTFTCSFLFMCSGYFRYEQGYTPAFEGSARFEGPIVHPQHWPDDLPTDDQRIIVIGSGATAVTLVPALAQGAAHVTMLQRSPTYIVSRPAHDPIANRLRRVLPEKLAYRLTRAKNVRYHELMYQLARRFPARFKARLLEMVAADLGEDEVAENFTPSYPPWEQRLCLVPEGDLFHAIRSGRASVKTAQIRRFTETGIELTSGEHLEADLIVTATGLDLVLLGGVPFDIDGEAIDFSKTWSYKGFAYSDVPNLATSFGYINSSWTLRSDLIATYVCRLLRHLRQSDTTVCTPRLRPSDHDMVSKPFVEGFTPGYMTRVMDRFPRQGDRPPWANVQSYRLDKRLFRRGPVDDGVMRFS